MRHNKNVSIIAKRIIQESFDTNNVVITNLDRNTNNRMLTPLKFTNDRVLIDIDPDWNWQKTQKMED